ncbi:MAG: hypothetical protein AB203_03760 [Parcubacteria bacterium C7867-008]|nr:MAG: hypothetical protein AB203_03760 [Parcubacteria bacterium C7867-008]
MLLGFGFLAFAVGGPIAFIVLNIMERLPATQVAAKQKSYRLLILLVSLVAGGVIFILLLNFSDPIYCLFAPFLMLPFLLMKSPNT